MDKIELVQKIGNDVCEGCGPHADCGEDPKECFRIINAINHLDNFLGKNASQPCTISHESLKSRRNEE